MDKLGTPTIQDREQCEQKQIKVLVVDDEQAIREMIRFALSKSDFKVRCATSFLSGQIMAWVMKAQPLFN